jgi:preprotein translocase subunit SecG
MSFMTILLILLLIIYIPVCILLILVVLAQEGKGGGISGLLSGGSALGDTFGASAGESFYRKWTRNIAVIFLVFTVLLTLVGKEVLKGGVTTALDKMPEITQPPGMQQLPDDLNVDIDGPNRTGLAEEIDGTPLPIPERKNANDDDEASTRTEK